MEWDPRFGAFNDISPGRGPSTNRIARPRYMVRLTITPESGEPIRIRRSQTASTPRSAIDKTLRFYSQYVDLTHINVAVVHSI